MVTTHIVRWGNSQGVRLPKYFLDSVNLSENDSVEMIAQNDSIIIRKSANRRHRTLKERLAGFSGSYVSEEWDTGQDVGEEIFWEAGGEDGL